MKKEESLRLNLNVLNVVSFLKLKDLIKKKADVIAVNVVRRKQ